MTKAPVIGDIYRATARGYVTFLNELRVAVFDHYYELLKADPKAAEKLKALAGFLNHATGRATGRAFTEKWAPVLSPLVFSSHQTVSRVQLVLKDPLLLLRRDEIAREYARSMGAFIGEGMAALFLVHALNEMGLIDATVGFDPRSTDFGKIKIGNQRIDFWGG